MPSRTWDDLYSAQPGDWASAIRSLHARPAEAQDRALMGLCLLKHFQLNPMMVSREWTATRDGAHTVVNFSILITDTVRDHPHTEQHDIQKRLSYTMYRHYYQGVHHAIEQGALPRHPDSPRTGGAVQAGEQVARSGVTIHQFAEGGQVGITQRFGPAPAYFNYDGNHPRLAVNWTNGRRGG